MQPFLALIMPVGGSGPVDPGYFPPGVGGPGSRPPSGNYPDNTLPGTDPGWSGGVVRPPSGRPPYPDNTLPGVDPGWSGGVVRPPSGGSNYPDHSLPGTDPGWSGGVVRPPPPLIPGGPIYIWGGGPGVRPPLVPPIDATLPPSEEGGPERKVDWKTAWTPTTGWVVVGIPQGEHPSPSGSKF